MESSEPTPPTDAPSPEAMDESLLARARAAVADKKARGVYSPAFLELLDQPLDIRPDPAFAAGTSWPEAVRTAAVSAEPPIISTRPGIGPILRALKSAIRRSLRWYLGPVTAQVSAHNQAVVDVLAEHSRQIIELRREVQELRRAVQHGEPGTADDQPSPPG
jgi:hypothetical protein